MNSSVSAKSISVTLAERNILNNISFETQVGHFVAVVGPNGAGKSTLLKTLAGIVAPKTGTVCWNGQNISKLNAKERALELAWVAQEPSRPEGVTVLEYVLQSRLPRLGYFGLTSAKDVTFARDAIAELGLTRFEATQVSVLSGGELRLASIARGLAQETRIIILDEPFTSLDIRHQTLIARVLEKKRERASTVIASFHDFSLAAQCASHAAVMRKGELVAFDTGEKALSKSVLEPVFQVHLDDALHVKIRRNP